MTDTTVLLGAGASSNAGIPTSGQLVAKIGREINGDPRLHAIFDAIHAGCLMRSASSRISGSIPVWPNIEDVANTIDALIDRRNSDLAPFVATWNPLLQYLEQGEDVDQATRQAVARAFQPKFVDASDGKTDTINTDWAAWADTLVNALRPRSPTDNSLRVLKQRLPVIVANLLTIPEDADVSYLDGLLELRSDDHQLSIATLNYDLVIERLCMNHEVTYSDGLENWRSGKSELFGHAAVALYKLHGSLDWERDSEDNYRRKMDTIAPAEPGIIFGGKNKLTTRGPYLDLLWRWRSELATKSTLIIIGYSFADSHVDGLLIQWARTHVARRAVIVSRSTSWHATPTGQWLLAHARATPRFELKHVQRAADQGAAEAVDYVLHVAH